MKVTVESVSGIAESRPDNTKNSKWKLMKVGDILTEQAIIRTGLGAKVVLKFGDSGDVTIKSGTKIVVFSFRKDGKRVKAKLDLRYGAIRARVDPSCGNNDLRVYRPVGRLGCRSPAVCVAQWGDFTFDHQETTGTWNSEIRKKIAEILCRRELAPDIQDLTDIEILYGEPDASGDVCLVWPIKIVKRQESTSTTRPASTVENTRPSNRKVPTTQPSAEIDNPGEEQE